MNRTEPGRAEPLRILHVITGLGAGGAERQLASLAFNSDPARMVHTIVSLREGGVWAERLRAGGIEVREIGLLNKLLAPLALPDLIRTIRGRRVDLVQTWLYHADLAGWAAARLTGRPLIWTVRGSHLRPEVYGFETRFLLRLLTRLSNQPRVIVANAVEGERWHRSIGYRARNWAVIPNGIDCLAFRPEPTARAAVRAELGLPDDAPLVGNMSRHDPMKDHPTLFAAFRPLAGRAWLLLAGDGIVAGNAALAGQIAAAGIDPARVLLLGPRTDVPRLLAALDVAALSSAFGEGFPNVVAEAMAVGIPSIGTDIGDTARIIGDCGIVTPVGDAAALGAGIARLLDLAPEARAALAINSRDRIETRFSLPDMVAAYQRLYDAVLAQDKG
jgi:glycosyltransferase involved in cell wall biosynthesis